MTREELSAKTKKEMSAKRKKDFLVALRATAGNISAACKKINIGRRTFYKWVKEDEEFKKEYEDIKEELLDFAESMLMKQIKDGNLGAIIFFLKTKGKSRGYIEHHRIEGRIDGEKKFVFERVDRRKIEK